MKRRCTNCKYYHTADNEHGDDGCYYWFYGSRCGYGCYITERLLKWCPLVISVISLLLVLLKPILVDMLR